MAKKEKYTGLSKDQKEELYAIAYDLKGTSKSLENAVVKYNEAFRFELAKLEKVEQDYQNLIDRLADLINEVTEQAVNAGKDEFAEEWEELEFDWGSINGVFGQQERPEEISFIDLGIINGEFLSDLPTEVGEED